MKQSIEITLREEQWVQMSELLDNLPPVVQAFRGLYEQEWEKFENDIRLDLGPRFYNVESGDYSSAHDWLTLGVMSGIRPYDTDLAIPEGLPPAAVDFCRELRAQLRAWGSEGCGGCKAFYTPEEAERFVETRGAVMVVVHDGGSLAPLFNLDYQRYKDYERVDVMLKLRNMWRESYNAAVTIIYPNSSK